MTQLVAVDLTSLLSILPIGAYRIGLDQRVLYANPALLQLNGFVNEAEMQVEPSEFIPNSYVDRSRRAFFYAQLHRDGQISNFESEAIRHKTGERIWIREHAQLVRDAQGTPLYFEGTVENITAQRLGIPSALQSESMLQNILQTIPDRLWIKDRNGVYLACNPAFASGLQVAADQIVGTHDTQWVGPNLAAAIRASDALAYQAGRAVRLEEEMMGPDGLTPVLYEIVKTPLLDSDGACMGLVCIARDIQQRKQVEAQLRDTSEQLELAIMGADLGQWDHDLTQEKGYRMDRRSCALLGLPLEHSDQRIGWGDLIHPEDLAATVQAMQNHLQGQSPTFVTEYRAKHSSGRWIWLSSRGKVVQIGQDGQALRMVGTVMDITERKVAEQTIEHFAFHDSLTGLANRRLLHERLLNAQQSSFRTQKYAAVLFLDLDYFKQLTATFGHETSDLLLQKVAQRLLQCSRAIDTVSRLGGDEFVVLAQDLGEDADAARAHASTVANKIIESLNAPYSIHDRSHTVTSSIGVCVFLGKNTPADVLLKQANNAMYEAKEQGHNTVVFYRG